jgi:hypothetical protein
MDIELAKAHKKYQEKLEQEEKIRMEYAANLVSYVNNLCDRLDLTTLKNKMISKTEKGKHKCYLFHIPMSSNKPKWEYAWPSFVEAIENIDIGAVFTRKLGIQGLRVVMDEDSYCLFCFGYAAFVYLQWDPVAASSKNVLNQ